MKRHLATLAIAVALTFVAATAWAYLSAGSVPGGSGAATASGVNQGATPTANATGSTVTVSWTATTLANGQAVSGYVVKRYDAVTQAAQTILSACTGTIATISCVESGVPNGSWTYAVTPVFATNWQGVESTKSATVVVNSDPTAPTNSLSLYSVTGGAFLSGSTIYYRGASAGGLRLANAVADAGSGPLGSLTAALGGITTGWTHLPSLELLPLGGPYVSAPFSWAAGTTSSPTTAVTGRDAAGNTAVTGLTFTNDSAAPSAGTISYADGYAAGRSVSVSFTTGSDTGSGIATRRLQRAIAPLAGGSCGSWGGFSDIGTDAPTSPYVDGSLGIACYKYRYVVTDRVGNQDVTTSSSSVAKVGYVGGVGATPGLLSHWRLGDSATTTTTSSSDSFTDTAGKLLTAHTGELEAGWTRLQGAANATISNEGRVYRAGLGYSSNLASLVPASADYTVEADLVMKSMLSDDAAGIIGRVNTASNTYYLASWEERDNSWNLAKVTNGSIGYLDYVANQPALVIGQTYRLKLEMVGSTLNLYVNGVLKVSDTDTSLTGLGRAGIMTGRTALSVAQTNNTGLHLDNFQVSATTRALDSKGDNHGAYVNGVTRGVAGALPGDSDTAASFDGVNDYVQILNTTGIPVGASSRSVEAWFKTTSAARQVIFDYGSLGATQEFGLWINPGGTAMTAWGWGGGNDKTFTMPSAVNNGAWHHVVITYDGTTLVLYMDGVALPSQTATRNTAIDSYGFGIGAVINPGDGGGNSGGFFHGTIDEVALYTTVLDPATVSAHYQLGGATATDTSGPTGGSVDATGLVGTGARYAPSTTLSLALSAGTDPSGVTASGQQLLRATASLTDGSCGTFGSYDAVATDPTSPASDAVADGACYRYQYVVSDSAGQPDHLHEPRHQGRRGCACGAVAGLVRDDQRVRLRRDGLLPVGSHLRLASDHRRGGCGVRHRGLRVPGAGQRMDGDPGRDGRDDVLLERRRPGGPRHQDRDRDQQRRQHLRGRAVHAHCRRHQALGCRTQLRRCDDDEHDRRRHAHHWHGRRLGDRHPAPAARFGAAHRQHLRRIRRLRDGRHQPGRLRGRHRDRWELLPVPVRRCRQRRQHGHRGRDEHRQGHPVVRHHGQRHRRPAQLVAAG